MCHIRQEVTRSRKIKGPIGQGGTSQGHQDQVEKVRKVLYSTIKNKMEKITKKAKIKGKKVETNMANETRTKVETVKKL